MKIKNDNDDFSSKSNTSKPLKYKINSIEDDLKSLNNLISNRLERNFNMQDNDSKKNLQIAGYIQRKSYFVDIIKKNIQSIKKFSERCPP